MSTPPEPVVFDVGEVSEPTPGARPGVMVVTRVRRPGPGISMAFGPYDVLRELGYTDDDLESVEVPE